MTPAQENQLFATIGKIDERTAHMQAQGCDKMSEHMMTLGEILKTKTTGGNGDGGDSKEGGKYTFDAKLFKVSSPTATGLIVIVFMVLVGWAVVIAIKNAKLDTTKVVTELRQAVIYDLTNGTFNTAHKIVLPRGMKE